MQCVTLLLGLCLLAGKCQTETLRRVVRQADAPGGVVISSPLENEPVPVQPSNEGQVPANNPQVTTRTQNPSAHRTTRSAKATSAPATVGGPPTSISPAVERLATSPAAMREPTAPRNDAVTRRQATSSTHETERAMTTKPNAASNRAASTPPRKSVDREPSEIEVTASRASKGGRSMSEGSTVSSTNTSENVEDPAAVKSSNTVVLASVVSGACAVVAMVAAVLLMVMCRRRRCAAVAKADWQFRHQRHGNDHASSVGEEVQDETRWSNRYDEGAGPQYVDVPTPHGMLSSSSSTNSRTASCVASLQPVFLGSSTEGEAMSNCGDIRRLSECYLIDHSSHSPIVPIRSCSDVSHSLVGTSGPAVTYLESNSWTQNQDSLGLASRSNLAPGIEDSSIYDIYGDRPSLRTSLINTETLGSTTGSEGWVDSEEPASPLSVSTVQPEYCSF